MTLECACEIIAEQLQLGGGCNRNAVRRLLGEVQREQGQAAAVNGLIRELDRQASFGLEASMVRISPTSAAR
jgi:hypothetical protein